MKGTAGENKKKFIKADRFNEIYKEYIRRFYVDKYMTTSDLLEVFSISNASFSDNRAKAYYALGKEPERIKKGSSVNLVEKTENQRNRNPFLEIYRHCQDDDSIYLLNVLLAMTFAEVLSDEADEIINSAKTDKYFSAKDIRSECYGMDLDSDEAPCGKVKCSKFMKDQCKKTGKCSLAKYNYMRGKWPEGLKSVELFTILEYLLNCYNEENNSKKYSDIVYSDANTKKAKLTRMVDSGYLNYENTKYSLRKTTLNSIKYSNDEDYLTRLTGLFELFSEIRPFGAVGYSVLDKLKPDNYTTPYRYKHRHIINALNDYNLIDIFYAIKNELYLEVTTSREGKTKSNTFVVRPLQVRYSTIDGRQYMVFYSPEKHSVSSMRIDYIQKLRIGNIETDEVETIAKEVATAKVLMQYCWNAGFSFFMEGNCSDRNIQLYKVTVTFKFGDDKTYNIQRIKREKRLENMTYRDDGDNTILEGYVTSYMDMQPWINTFLSYVVLQQWIPATMDIETGNIMDGDEIDFLSLDQIPATFIKTKDKNPSEKYLFSQDYSYAYRNLSALFYNIMNSSCENHEDVRAILNGLTDDKPSGSDAGNIYIDDLGDFFDLLTWLRNKSAFSTSFDRDYSVENDYPLTRLECNWIGEVMRSPMSLLFLSEVERDYTLSKLIDQNIFSWDDINYFDQIPNTDLCYKDSFNVVLKAISSRKGLKITYKKERNNGVYYPDSLVYSLSDNTLKLYALCEDGTTKILRVDSIESVEFCEGKSSFDKDEIAKQIDKMINYSDSSKTVTIGVIETNKNITDRFFREISSYSTNCRKNESFDLDKENVIKLKMALREYANGDNVSINDMTGKLYQGVIKQIKIDDKQIQMVLETNEGVVSLGLKDIEIVDISKDSFRCSWPLVKDIQEELFEYIVEIAYPGNEYYEIVSRLISFGSELFILDSIDQTNMDNDGDRRRQQNVSFETLRRSLIQRDLYNCK